MGWCGTCKKNLLKLSLSCGTGAALEDGEGAVLCALSGCGDEDVGGRCLSMRRAWVSLEGVFGIVYAFVSALKKEIRSIHGQLCTKAFFMQQRNAYT